MQDAVRLPSRPQGKPGPALLMARLSEEGPDTWEGCQDRSQRPTFSRFLRQFLRRAPFLSRGTVCPPS